MREEELLLKAPSQAKPILSKARIKETGLGKPSSPKKGNQELKLDGPDKSTETRPHLDELGASTSAAAHEDEPEHDAENVISTYHEIMSEDFELNDTRIAMIGNVDSGKVSFEIVYQFFILYLKLIDVLVRKHSPR